MIRPAVLALAFLLAGCAGYNPGPARVPGTLQAERPERMPSNAAPQPPGSMPR